MRGYGESEKPLGVAEYYADKLTGDVKELVEYLGQFQTESNFYNLQYCVYSVKLYNCSDCSLPLPVPGGRLHEVSPGGA